MCSMRQVWKPLEWAEMPRMACMLTGRPIILSWLAPGPVGPRHVEHDFLSKAASASSRAMRRISVGAFSPHSSATASGEYCGIHEALGQKLERRAPPCGRRRSCIRR